MNVMALGFGHDLGLQQTANNAGIGQVHLHLTHAGSIQAIECQLQNFEVGLGARMAVNFGTQLQGLACGVGPGWTRVQHRPAIAKTRQRCAAQQMGINARHLRRGVSTQTQGATRQLVHQLEGLQIQGLARAGQQGLQMLQQRRHDQLVAIATGGIQHFAAEFFDVASLGGQDIGNMIREDPSRHEGMGETVKNGILPGCHGHFRPSDQQICLNLVTAAVGAVDQWLKKKARTKAVRPAP